MRGYILVDPGLWIKVDSIASVRRRFWNRAEIILYSGESVLVKNSVEEVFAAMRSNS